MSFVPPEQPERNYVAQSTLQYSTFLKRNIVESLQDAFENHPTGMVRNAKVDVDTTTDRWRAPGVIVKFYEREMPNAGVGHYEWLPAPENVDPNNPTIFIKYYHRLYKGDISFEIWAKSSTDRDIVRDALIEVLGMADSTPGGYSFLQRLYFYLNQTPYGLWHFPVLNTDLITGYGETQSTPPWSPEDQLLYNVTYRVPIFGEYYSITPKIPTPHVGLVSEVDVTVAQYTDPFHPQQTYPPEFYKFLGWPTGMREIT